MTKMEAMRQGFSANGLAADKVLEFAKRACPKLFGKAGIWWVTPQGRSEEEEPVLVLRPRGDVRWVRWPLAPGTRRLNPPSAEDHMGRLLHPPMWVCDTLQADGGTPDDQQHLLIADWLAERFEELDGIRLARRVGNRPDGAVMSYFFAVRKTVLADVLDERYARRTALGDVWHALRASAEGADWPLVVEALGATLQDDLF